MTLFQVFVLFFLRVTLGFMMFYAGITKVLDPEWSPFGYLARAKTFPDLYALLLDPAVLSYVTVLNAWGLTLVGVALLLGVGTRIASVCGVLFMTLYYFPVLVFPYVGEHSFIVDEHVIYAAGFLGILAFGAAHPWSLGALLQRLPFFAKHPRLSGLIG